MILTTIPAKHNPSSFYYVLSKKKYINNSIISYKHASYYKKTTRVTEIGNALASYLNLEKGLKFKKKKIKSSKTTTISLLRNRRLLNLVLSRKMRNLRSFIRAKRFTLRHRPLPNQTPMQAFFYNLPRNNWRRYSFLKKNSLLAKSNKRSFKKLLKTRTARSKSSRFINESTYFNKRSILMVKNQSTPKIRLKNLSYSFTLKNSPLYISYKFNNKPEKFTFFKSNLKKTIFSFLKPNQIRKSLMLRRQKISYFRFFNRYNKKDMSSRFLLTNYKRIYNSIKHSDPNTRTGKYSESDYYFYIKPFFSSLSDNLFTQKYSTFTDFKGEVFLPRVRFKPGYQRLWRQSRTTLAESLKFKYIYQQQFTKYLTRFNRKLHGYHFSRDEYTLSSMLLYSRLISDYNTLVLLNKSSCVFVNGYTNTNLSYTLFIGDIIQLLVSNWMYIYLKWVTLWTSYRVKKFRKLVYRKNLARSYKVMKARKQKSNYTPLWIHHTRHDISDIKPSLETDFFTMSSVLVYDNFLFDFYTPSWYIEDRQNIYRLYNWKYIT